MKLGDAVDQIDTFTGRASENVRALAFAGLAFVWLLAGDLSRVRGDLFIAATLLLLALFADFAHYVIGVWRWERFVRRFENEHEEVSRETPITYDDSVIRPIYVAWYVKIVIIVAAYVALTIVVVSRLAAVASPGEHAPPAATRPETPPAAPPAAETRKKKPLPPEAKKP